MNKKLKLKRSVLPIVYAVLIFFAAVSTILTFKTTSDSDMNMENINYVSDILLDEVPVVSVDKVIIKPFNNESIKIGKYFYDYTDSTDEQRNSIIFYENSYIQNTGIDYILDNVFDIVSVYDGEVTKVEDNELVGKIVEIKHENNLISVYQSLSEVNVKIGDKITQGTIIGKSGTSKINKDLGNHLHFELYVNGEVINPLDCFDKKISDL